MFLNFNCVHIKIIIAFEALNVNKLKLVLCQKQYIHLINRHLLLVTSEHYNQLTLLLTSKQTLCVDTNLMVLLYYYFMKFIIKIYYLNSSQHIIILLITIIPYTIKLVLLITIIFIILLICYKQKHSLYFLTLCGEIQEI